MSWIESAKKRAAMEAVRHVRDGFVLGLGTGTTTAFVIEEIGRRIREERLDVLGVPTSNQASRLATKHGVPITALSKHPRLDLDIDGADQIDESLNLIKGRGGAFAREKIVASASKKLIIVADETKLAKNLGGKQSLPIEVLPFAVPLVLARIRELGGKPLLKASSTKGPFVTDNGNFVLDVDFGTINEPVVLDRMLKSIPGVVESGLFIEMADMAYVGSKSAVKLLKKNHL